MRIFYSYWQAVICLAISAFVMILTEFSPIALLSQMAIDLHQPYDHISFAVTIYALVGATCGLLASLFLYKVPRKPLLILLLIMITLSNLLVASASNLPQLLVYRAIGAVGHGIFWATVADYAMKLVSPAHQGKASNLVFMGISLASIMGIPLVNFIGYHFSWRWTFIFFALIGVLLSICLYFTLPSENTQKKAEALSIEKIKKLPVVICLITATGLTAVFQFSIYTFIEPLLIQLLPQTTVLNVSTFLFLFGFSGFIANMLGFIWIDPHIIRLTWIAILSCFFAFLLLALSLSHVLIDISWIIIAIISWGGGIAVLFATLQTWVIRQSKQLSSASSALNSAILNYCIAIGAMIGALLIRHTNLQILVWVSCLLSMLTFVFIVLSTTLSWRNQSDSVYQSGGIE